MSADPRPIVGPDEGEPLVEAILEIRLPLELWQLLRLLEPFRVRAAHGLVRMRFEPDGELETIELGIPRG